ncbi:uncharacterized protein LOC143783275 [Ranitomeya variabilis]|uniref:uncharacterized protein LOC143783275 n=1 Tax=Ranitomeya variabilis TaxID=490064 RepID=UPI00405679A1
METQGHAGLHEEGQPLASQKEPNVHKEFIPSTMNGMETQLINAMKVKERNILKGSKTKLQQTSLTQILQMEETSEESTVKHIRRKICKKGVPRNKIVPYVDKQSAALTSKEDFDIDKKRKRKESPEKHFQQIPKIETDEHKQRDKYSTSTSYLDELEKHQYSVCTAVFEIYNTSIFLQTVIIRYVAHLINRIPL